jgi:hypothetical protein
VGVRVGVRAGVETGVILLKEVMVSEDGLIVQEAK